jgi:hypothetical protein
MKPFHHRTLFAILVPALLFLTSCEHNISIGSNVNEDGSLERTVVLHKADSSKAIHNILGVSEGQGWETVVAPARESVAETKATKHDITFVKRFASVDEANAEMGRSVDTLFQIHSTFEKQNRWFYTYLEYSDTYRSLDRLKTLPVDDYFTREDYAFIDRLPAEGSRITKSDSLYLSRLNEKIFDIYGARTLYEEMFRSMLSTMRDHNVPSNWSDSLHFHKEKIYQQFFEGGELNDADFLAVADRINMPLPPEAREAVRRKTEELEKRLDFISDAYSGKYLHAITLPWTVVSSNADSAASNTLFWKPPVIKFLLQDYTMTASARKMNVWAVGISAVLVLATAGLFLLARKRLA